MLLSGSGRLVADATQAGTVVLGSYYLLGDRDDAASLLRQALSKGYPWLYQIRLELSFEPVRGYPPFEELVRPKG